MTKNDNKKAWFILMAKVETEWSANFVAWMKISDDLNNFRTCKEVIKWDKTYHWHIQKNYFHILILLPIIYIMLTN
jgi:hypothetical protein